MALQYWLRPYNLSGHSAKLSFCGMELYKAAVGGLTLPVE